MLRRWGPRAVHALLAMFALSISATRFGPGEIRHEPDGASGGSTTVWHVWPGGDSALLALAVGGLVASVILVVLAAHRGGRALCTIALAVVLATGLYSLGPLAAFLAGWLVALQLRPAYSSPRG